MSVVSLLSWHGPGQRAGSASYQLGGLGESQPHRASVPLTCATGTYGRLLHESMCVSG